MPIHSTPDVIEWAKVTQYLASVEAIKLNAAGGSYQYDKRLPLMLKLVRQSVEWQYNQNPNHLSLTETTNYLYRLCGKYIYKAKEIVSNISTGCTIVNSFTVNVIEFGGGYNLFVQLNADPSGNFKYNLNGGSDITINSNAFTIPNVSTGTHTVYIKSYNNLGAVCLILSKTVVIAQPSVCVTVSKLVVSNITGSSSLIVGTGSAVVNFTTSGIGGQFRYSLNGAGFNNIGSNPFNLSGLLPGNYSIQVISLTGDGEVCSSVNSSFYVHSQSILVNWSWQQDQFGTDIIEPGMDVYEIKGSAGISNGQNVVVDVHTMPINSYLVIRVPLSQPIKNIWDDTGSVFNSGTIPDQIFRAVENGNGFNYYITRVPVTMSTGVNDRLILSTT